MYGVSYRKEYFLPRLKCLMHNKRNRTKNNFGCHTSGPGAWTRRPITLCGRRWRVVALWSESRKIGQIVCLFDPGSNASKDVTHARCGAWTRRSIIQCGRWWRVVALWSESRKIGQTFCLFDPGSKASKDVTQASCGAWIRRSIILYGRWCRVWPWSESPKLGQILCLFMI